MRIHVVRHGETRHNAEKRIQGQTLDDGLNETGVQQAEALARHYAVERARGLHVAAVYASPLKRAYETGLAIARALDLPDPRPMHGLKEVHWGQHAGKLNEGATLADMTRVLTAWDAGDLTAHAPDGETPGDAWQRLAKDLEEVIARHPLDDVVIVGHGRINKILISGLLHGDLHHMDEHPQANAGITLLEGGPPWRLARGNETGHLTGLRALDERHS